MPRVRKIDRNPRDGKNYYLVDACFLANRYIPADRVSSKKEKERIFACMRWWGEIQQQLKEERARIYVPDVCIAETFKVLANAYFKKGWFRSSQQHVYWRTRLRNDITVSSKMLRSQRRTIHIHDLPTCRDIIIAVDRFYEMFAKKDLKVSIPDLIIPASAKYLMDFFDIPKDRLHIITMDNNLRRLTKEISELPNAYNPTTKVDDVDRIFG